MDVIHVPSPILFVSQKVLPETPLPDLFLAPFIHRPFDPCRKVIFDQPPSGGKIGIPGRKIPDAMEVTRKDHKCLHGKGKFFLDLIKCQLEAENMIRRGQNLLPFMRDDGEEIGASRLIETTIFAHKPKMVDQ